MSREIVNAICRTFPGAEVSDPWGGGHDAWKVGGKMFACIGAVMPGVSVKTDSIETAQMLIDLGVGVKAPYFHRSWVNLPWGTSEEELRHRLAASYKLVRSSLTKKVHNIVQEGLPDAIPVEACYLGWQDSLRNLASLVEPDIHDNHQFGGSKSEAAVHRIGRLGADRYWLECHRHLDFARQIGILESVRVAQALARGPTCLPSMASRSLKKRVANGTAQAGLIGFHS